MPESVKTIEVLAFAKCTALSEVNYQSVDPIRSTKNIFSKAVYDNATLNIAVGGLEKAKQVIPWKFFVNIKEVNYSDIDDISAEIDKNAPIEVYNVNGIKIADTTDNLPSGFYILRQGKIIKKIIVD